MRRQNISVIIPMYNMEKTLARCVGSLTGQHPGEILLVDDGSKDRTLAIADELRKANPAIRIIRQDHAGVSEARNRGIREAENEWLLFLDADDTLTQTALQDLADCLEKETDASYGIVLRGYRKSKTAIKNRTVVTDRHEMLNYTLQAPTDRLTVHGWLLRKSVCTDYRVFFNPNLTFSEDSDFILRYLSCCRAVCFLATPVYCYTRSPVSTINTYISGKTEAYLSTLHEIGKGEAAKERNWPLFVLTTLLLILTHDTFHPANPARRREQFMEAKRLRKLPEMEEAFRKADLTKLERKKRICLRILKHRRIPLAFLVVRMRQWQNAKG